MHRYRVRAASAVLMTLGLIQPAPALADGTAATGVAAALGLTAASGKTTIASGGGVSETALLTSEALGRTGRLIAALVRTKVATRPVFVLTHDQQLDLSAPRYVADRVAQLRKLLAGDGCLAAPAGDLGGGAFKPKASDIGAALATDTTISSVPLTIDDRVLVTAIAMSSTAGGAVPPTAWVSDEAASLTPATADATTPALGSTTTFLIPGDMLVVPAHSKVMAEFQAMLSDATRQRSCAKDPKTKGVLDDVDSFAKAITTPPDKGGMTLLAQAAALEAAAAGTADILRVSVEQAGGTAITRSNIWYTVGFPGAAIVSASLIASFRLIDGSSGQPLLAGFVRCAVAPVNIKDVPDALSSSRRRPDVEQAKVSCSYLAPAR